MNKTLNTVIFVVSATVFLSLCILVIFFALLIPLLVLLPSLDDSVRFLFLGLIFAAALFGGLLIYNRTLKWVARKYDLEKYLPTRRPKPKQGDN